jgi:hypothetical protein
MNTLRYLNLASFVPFPILEASQFLVKYWRVGYYESKDWRFSGGG